MGSCGFIESVYGASCIWLFYSNVPYQTHVLENGDHIFSLSKILIIVWDRVRLSFSLIVINIDQLIVMHETSVSFLIFLQLAYGSQVTKLLITPVVELSNGWS